MPGESKTSSRRIQAAYRQKQALALRLGGASFEQIAVTLGYADPSGAYRSVMAALQKVPAVEARAMRKLNIERLNQMRLGNWKNAVQGDKDSIASEIDIEQEEAKLLGLYAPQKTALTTAAGEDVSLVDLIRQAAELNKES